MKYTIKGEPTPAVICELEPGESMITERGSMVWMSPNLEMQTSAGGMGKVFGRLFSGESIFQNIYTARGGPGMIAFASSFPGTIRAIRITPDPVSYTHLAGSQRPLQTPWQPWCTDASGRR